MSQSNDRKRKMDARTGGDSSKSSSSQEGSCSKPKNACKATGCASGDMQTGANHGHEFVAVLRDLEDEGSPATVHIQPCDMQDVWASKVPLPLSGFETESIKTGNDHYDKLIPDLPGIGYRPLRILYKGQSGTILLAQDVREGITVQEKECVPVAIKLHSGRKKKSQQSSEDDEILIHQRLQHQNIVTFIRSISNNGRTGMVLEFCACGNLDALLKTKDATFIHENIARRYLHQLHGAVEYIHLTGVAHRDICLQNILVTNDNTLKLCDFSQAVNFSAGDSPLVGLAGSRGYQPPEMLLNQSYSPRHADLYALGCVLYHTVTGRLPYGRLKNQDEVRALKPLEFPSVLVLSLSAKELLTGMLSYMPDSRFTLNRVRNSDWFQSTSEKVQIGSFYLVRQPQKIADGEKERDVKAEYDI